MKGKGFLLVVSIFVCMLTISFAVASDPTNADPKNEQAQQGKPIAYVAHKSFTFDTALEGEIISHAFAIENQGTAPLEVLDVHTSCGCTTAERPAVILPGAKDRILVKGNTRGYGGSSFNKTIIVATNDPLKPKINLRLKGSVIPFADIEPRRIVLRGSKNEKLAATATITPNSRSPFKIVSSKVDDRLADKIDVTIDHREGTYHVVVNNRDSSPGSYRGRIILRTDNTIQPTLTLFVNGQILN